mgnify:CR=1 FL=1
MPFTDLDALLIAARKRGFLDEAQVATLRQRMTSAGVADHDALVRWLEIEARLGGELPGQLQSLVAPAGRDFGAYRSLAHLADGGMGSVYLAADAAGQPVVIKTLRSHPDPMSSVHYAEDEDGSIWIGESGKVEPTMTPPTKRGESSGGGMDKRFEREARITRQLRHAHIVHCLDHGAAKDGTLYLVLEYVPNGDLRELVAERTRLSEALAIDLVRQVSEGLAAAHALNLIHRDIKPHNIFVAADGTAKLADFGFARTTHVNRTQLTMQGTMVGSPAYMSPEQVEPDRELDIRSDIYALGAVLHFCLTGQPPYQGSIPEILHQHRTAPVPDVRVLVSHLAPTTGAVVARCLAKDPADRFPNPIALRDALAAAHACLHGAPLSEQALASSAAAGAATVLLPLREGWTGAPTARVERTAAHLMPTPRPSRAEPSTVALEPVAKAGAPAPASPAGEPVTLAAPENSAAPTGPVPEAPAPLPPDALVGDIALGFGEDWLCLAPEARGESTLILLYARPRLVFGKFKDPSVDVCLRNYPVDTHLAACQRLSRSHLALSWERARGACLVQDLGSSNGTTVDGERALESTPLALTADREHIVDLAKVVVLRLRAVARRDRRPECVAGYRVQGERLACGLDAAHEVDAVIVTRPRNRPELAYAQVLRRLSVGGPGADLACAGASTPARCEFGLVAGRWIWRPDRHGEAWRPLTPESALDCGGVTLRPRPATLADF